MKQDKDIQHLNKLFKRLQPLLEARNAIAHCSWHVGDTADSGYVLRVKGKNVTGAPGGAAYRFTIDDINQETHLVDNMGQELWKFFWDRFGGWIRDRGRDSGSGIYTLE